MPSIDQAAATALESALEVLGSGPLLYSPTAMAAPGSQLTGTATAGAGGAAQEAGAVPAEGGGRAPVGAQVHVSPGRALGWGAAADGSTAPGCAVVRAQPASGGPAGAAGEDLASSLRHVAPAPAVAAALEAPEASGVVGGYWGGGLGGRRASS